MIKNGAACLLLALLGLCLLSGCRSSPAPAAQNTETAGASAAQSGSDFSVNLLSTGKSDCAIIHMDGLVIVNDTADSDDYGAISAALKNGGTTRIDYLILSHYDKDHIGSAAALIHGFEVGMILRPDYEKQSPEYNALVVAEKARNVPVEVLREDYRIETSNGTITVDPPKEDYGDDNNNSLITTVSYRGHNLLFLGDAEKKRLDAFLDAAEDIYDFMKLPHHGDINKKLDSLLRRTTPRWAAETVASAEDVAPELVKRLKTLGTTLYCTADGSVFISWDGSALAVTQTPMEPVKGAPSQ